MLQVSFHPLSDVHLLILTNDSVLRVYNIKENLNLPCQEFALDSVAHAPLASSGPAARRDSGASWAGSAPQRSAHTSFGQTKPMATGFCFGAQPSSRASAAAATTAGDAASPNWDIFSLYFLYASGSIAMVCPTLPPKVCVERRTVAAMRRAEQARLDGLQLAAADRDRDRADQDDDLTVEQLQARLLWIGETFGLYADEDDRDGASGGVLVSQDLSAAVASGMPAAWIQPAQPCGANAQTGPNAHSQSFLALPGSASALSAYPYPASHLFSFRHAWPYPPGRFFRAFIDGRLDLLLSLQPVQPLFATRKLSGLCGEVDAAAAPTVVHLSAALDEMCSLLAPGGALESYAVSTFLLPADVSHLQNVEVPMLSSAASGPGAVASGSAAAGSLLSRAASLQSPPGMMRPTSSVSPSLTRGGSTFAAAAPGVASLGSPLQPFNPQFRPLIDVHDGSGLFVSHPRGVVHASYGEQLDEIGAILARGEDDVFVSVQGCFEHMQCEQRSMTAPLPLGATRHVVGAVLLDDPLLGRYLLQLTAGGASGSVAAPGPHIEVVELSRRSAPSAPSIRSLMEVTSAGAGASHSSRTVAEVTQALASASLNEEMKELAKYLTPFDEEIRPFLARMRALPPPPRLTPVPGGAAAILNSPEALGEFLSIRKHFVGAIQELTAVQSLLSTRVEMLGAFALEQQRLFSGLEKDVVRARAQQAKLDDQLETHMEMQKHLGVSAQNKQ